MIDFARLGPLPSPVLRVLACLATLSVAIATSRGQNLVHHAQGEMAGEPTTTSILLQSRLTALPGPDLDAMGDMPGAAGVAAFEWSEVRGFEQSWRTEWLPASAEHDFIVRARLEGLQPGREYFYRLLLGVDPASARAGPLRRFKTLPGADSSAAASFCMGSCMNYNTFVHGVANGGGPITATEEDKRLGYPSFAAMNALHPDFFVGTGDIVYYDNPARGAARELPELRRKWHEQFHFPRIMNFLGSTPAFWSKDDHDFRFNDADLRGERLPLPAAGIELFREQMPILMPGDRTSATYRTHRINRDLQLWFTEGRDYRSPNRSPDGPDKSLWGVEQREWLKRTLAESDAVWKIIITPTPMVGPDDARKKDNHANLGGFRHEADAFFNWLNENEIQRVFTFCGDRHWQYHSIHPSGVEEFSCGALNDENSRRGVAPGSQRGTDPEGLIQQPYTYPKPTGGFLLRARIAATRMSLG